MRASKPKVTSFRPDKSLEKPINQWLKSNPGINQSTLYNMAIRKFISEDQTLHAVQLTEASNKSAEAMTNRMMKDHADMLDKLK